MFLALNCRGKQHVVATNLFEKSLAMERRVVNRSGYDLHVCNLEAPGLISWESESSPWTRVSARSSCISSPCLKMQLALKMFVET